MWGQLLDLAIIVLMIGIVAGLAWLLGEVEGRAMLRRNLVWFIVAIIAGIYVAYKLLAR